MEVFQERIVREKLQVLAVVAVLVPRRFLNIEFHRPRSKVVHDGVKGVVVRR